MKRLVLTSFAVVLVAVLVPGLALAKGASEAQVEGPGLDDAIVLGGAAGSGEPGSGDPLGQIAEAAGFFPAVFAQSPDPMLDEQPASELGPKYTITYVMPGPNNELDRLRQVIYPYAEPDPVTYTAPGQQFWATEQTRGGWFVASSFLKDSLVEAGLPENAPTPGDADGFPLTVASGLIALAAVLGLGALAALLIRRRPGTATAS